VKLGAALKFFALHDFVGVHQPSPLSRSSKIGPGRTKRFPMASGAQD
jgi:hypothetical protein